MCLKVDLLLESDKQPHKADWRLHAGFQTNINTFQNDNSVILQTHQNIETAHEHLLVLMHPQPVCFYLFLFVDFLYNILPDEDINGN